MSTRTSFIFEGDFFRTKNSFFRCSISRIVCGILSTIPVVLAVIALLCEDIVLVFSHASMISLYSLHCYSAFLCSFVIPAIFVQDVILVQLKELRDELVLLEKEKRAVETEWKTLSQEHNSVLQKVEVLEFELENQKKLVVEKDQLLELSKEELLGLSARFQDLQSKLEAQVGTFPGN